MFNLLLKLCKSQPVLFLTQHAPIIAASLVVACFVLTRLPFFLHFPLADVAIDYWSHFDVIEQARHGQWPKLYLRTPGYPLFLAAVFLISRTAMAVVAAQCLAALAAALGTLACFVRADRRLTYPAALAIIGFTSSMHSVLYDMTLLTESLYASLLMLSVGLLTLAILRGGAWVLAATSLAMVGTIWVRPTGAFLVVIYALMLGWLLSQRQPRRQILAFALPLPSVLLATCAYNWLTIDTFILTPVSDHAIIGAVALYVEEDPTLPTDVNEAVRAIRDNVKPEDRAIALTSHDPDKLTRVFNTYNETAIYTHMAKVKRPYMEINAIQRRLAWSSIRQHPEIYLKFVAANFYKYFENSLAMPDIYAHLPFRYDIFYVQHDRFAGLPEGERRGVLMEYSEPPPQPHIRREGEQTVIDITWSRQMHERFNEIHEAIFARAVWILAALLLFPVAIWKLARSRGRDARALLVFLHVSAIIGAGLAIALFGMAMPRYGAPGLFLAYLTPLYLCLLIQPEKI